MSTLRFRIATEPRDLEQIHALNHKIFAEEIGQRALHPSGVLIATMGDVNPAVLEPLFRELQI